MAALLVLFSSETAAIPMESRSNARTTPPSCKQPQNERRSSARQETPQEYVRHHRRRGG